jgi:hexosaminidase
LIPALNYKSTFMKYLLLFLFSVLLALPAPLAWAALAEPGLAQHPTLNLMPVPAEMTLQEGKFRLTGDLKIAVTGNPDQRLYPAITRALRRLDDRTGLFFAQATITAQDQDPKSSVVIQTNRPGKVELHEDESYQLTVTSSGIGISAETDLGAMHGLETLLQLVSADETGYYLPAVRINDSPRFPWRGILIDVARHWLPMEVIKRNIDGLAAVKMNVLHLHLTEDQGFRIESKKFPKLHEMGSDGYYYTQDQMREIIQYAGDRGIRVMPEFDLPGHATSWLVGYPELASGPGPYSIERKFGIMEPTIDPTKEETYTFLDSFFAEMAALFPDAYMHIGGDENTGKQWDANPAIQAYMKAKNIKDNHSLQAYFNQRLLKILTKYNKKMVGWDEIFQPELPNSIVIQSWRGKKYLNESARKGFQGILSNGYYLDLIFPTDVHYLNDPAPADAKLTAEQRKLILGGESAIWSEFVTVENIDSRIWPRNAAIAERLWSPEEVKDVNDMYRRLDAISLHLEQLGLTHEKNYAMMLRRLAGGGDITAVKTLIDVIEPVKEYARFKQGIRWTSHSPLTGPADVARPDSRVARTFRALTKHYVANPNADTEAQIRYWLNLWQNNHEQLQRNMVQSPVLKQLESLSADLAHISRIGLESLDHLSGKQRKKSTENWMETRLKVLENAKKPRAVSELMVVAGIETLVREAAAKKQPQ